MKPVIEFRHFVYQYSHLNTQIPYLLAREGAELIRTLNQMVDANKSQSEINQTLNQLFGQGSFAEENNICRIIWYLTKKTFDEGQNIGRGAFVLDAGGPKANQALFKYLNNNEDKAYRRASSHMQEHRDDKNSMGIDFKYDNVIGDEYLQETHKNQRIIPLPLASQGFMTAHFILVHENKHSPEPTGVYFKTETAPWNPSKNFMGSMQHAMNYVIKQIKPKHTQGLENRREDEARQKSDFVEYCENTAEKIRSRIPTIYKKNKSINKFLEKIKKSKNYDVLREHLITLKDALMKKNINVGINQILVEERSRRIQTEGSLLQHGSEVRIRYKSGSASSSTEDLRSIFSSDSIPSLDNDFAHISPLRYKIRRDSSESVLSAGSKLALQRKTSTPSIQGSSSRMSLGSTLSLVEKRDPLLVESEKMANVLSKEMGSALKLSLERFIYTFVKHNYSPRSGESVETISANLVKSISHAARNSATIFKGQFNREASSWSDYFVFEQQVKAHLKILEDTLSPIKEKVPNLSKVTGALEITGYDIQNNPGEPNSLIKQENFFRADQKGIQQWASEILGLDPQTLKFNNYTNFFIVNTENSQTTLESIVTTSVELKIGSQTYTIPFNDVRTYGIENGHIVFVETIKNHYFQREFSASVNKQIGNTDIDERTFFEALQNTIASEKESNKRENLIAFATNIAFLRASDYLLSSSSKDFLINNEYDATFLLGDQFKEKIVQSKSDFQYIVKFLAECLENTQTSNSSLLSSKEIEKITDRIHSLIVKINAPTKASNSQLNNWKTPYMSNISRWESEKIALEYILTANKQGILERKDDGFSLKPHTEIVMKNIRGVEKITPEIFRSTLENVHSKNQASSSNTLSFNQLYDRMGSESTSQIRLSR